MALLCTEIRIEPQRSGKRTLRRVAHAVHRDEGIGRMCGDYRLMPGQPTKSIVRPDGVGDLLPIAIHETRQSIEKLLKGEIHVRFQIAQGLFLRD